MEDFANAIVYEVKQEIADRYFGFRTRIENQSQIYLAKLTETGRAVEAEIRLDLCRMRFLLKEPRLFCLFLDMANLPRDYVLNLANQQATPKGLELFATMRGRGFTRWRRFYALAKSIYNSLAKNIVVYHETYLQLQEEHADICMEIEKFQHQNDLSDILCFLRNFDSPDSERMKFLHSNATLLSCQTLEQDLRITPPPPVTEVIKLLNPLPPIRQIKAQLTDLLREAFTHHDCSSQGILPF